MGMRASLKPSEQPKTPEQKWEALLDAFKNNDKMKRYLYHFSAVYVMEGRSLPQVQKDRMKELASRRGVRDVYPVLAEIYKILNEKEYSRLIGQYQNNPKGLKAECGKRLLGDIISWCKEFYEHQPGFQPIVKELKKFEQFVQKYIA